MIRDFMRDKTPAQLLMIVAIVLLFVSQFFLYLNDGPEGMISRGTDLIHATQLQSVYVTAPEYKDWEKQNIPLMFSQMAGVFSQWQKHVNSTQDLINILGTQNIQGLQFPEGTPQDQQNMALLNSNLQLLIQYGNLRFIKLCEYLKKREPDFQIGYSINAYRLTEQDLRKAGTFPDVGFDEKYTDELAKKLGILTPDKRYTK